MLEISSGKFVADQVEGRKCAVLFLSTPPYPFLPCEITMASTEVALARLLSAPVLSRVLTKMSPLVVSVKTGVGVVVLLVNAGVGRVRNSVCEAR